MSSSTKKIGDFQKFKENTSTLKKGPAHRVPLHAHIPESLPSAERKQDETTPSTQSVPNKYPGSTQSVPNKYPGSTQSVPNKYPGSTQSVPSTQSMSITQFAKTLLAPQQARIYEWFLQHGREGTFNKGLVSRETGISTETIKKTLLKFRKMSIIETGIYDPSSRRQSYRLNIDIKIDLSQAESPTSIPSTQSVPTPLIRKKERIFLNLSIPDFWLNQGLTQQKLNAWMKEFDFSNDEWKTQLMFSVHEPKVRNANSPIKYFYKSLKQGGLTRPDGFEFPEERQTRIKEEELQARTKLIEKEKQLREQEKKLAEEESLLSLLKDRKTIEEAIKEFEKTHMTPKFKISIKTFQETGSIDDRLENRLRMWLRDSSECT